MNNQVFISMKLRITESQLKKAKLITEGQEVVHTFMTKADDIKEIINRLYSKVTFATLAEIIEGDIDLNVITTKLEQLRTVMYTYHKKGEMFFNNMPEDEFYSDQKWDDLQMKMDDKYQEVLYHKLDVLEELIESLKDIKDGDIEKSFKDIKKLDI